MRKLVSALVLASSLVALPAYAQFGLPGLENSISIGMSPAHPGPGDTVTLTAESSVFDLPQSSIVWNVNGKVVAQGVGATSVSTTVGGLGSLTSVTVDASAADGTSAEASAQIVPTEVDLLYDSDSYAPPFYRGKSLPSAGSNLYLQALPHFVSPNGSSPAASSLTYTWKKNGQVMGTVSGRGKSAIVIPAPVLYETDIMSVDVASSDGSLSGETSITVAAADPTVMLYEDHPLFGVLYGNALSASTFLPDSEMTFAAIPYFASVRTPSDPLLQYAWRVNGSSIATDPAKPNELTLQASPSNDTALIQLALTHATNFFLDASGSWNVSFSTASTNGSQNPFDSATQ